MKKVLAVLLALAMVLSLAACSGSGSGETTKAAETEAAKEDTKAAETEAAKDDTKAAETEAPAPADDGGEEPAAESAYDTHIKISMDVLNAEKTDKSEKDEFFRNKFNIEWELYPVTWEDWLEKIRTWVNGDDMPDIVWWDMKASNTAEFKKWAAAGAFREIPEDLSKWPNLAQLREELFSDDLLLSVDGKLYGWPSSRKNPEFIDNAYYSMFAYRRDWAKAVGMYNEGDVYTWDEVKAMIDAVKEQDPGGNGVGNTIGIVSATWAFPGVYAELNAAQPDRIAYQKDENGDYYLYAKTEKMAETVAFVRDLYQGGYIWKDQPNSSGDDGADKFHAGQAFMYLANNSPSYFNGDPLNKMVRGGICDADAVAPMIVKSAVGEPYFYLLQTEDYWTVASISHNVDDEKFERILDMWDWLASEEGRIFLVAGVEGKDYEVNADGTYNILWDQDENGMYISPYQDYAFNIYTPATLTASPNETSVTYGYDLFEPVYDYMQNSGNFKCQHIPWEVMAWDGPAYSEYGYFESDVNAQMEIIVTDSNDIDAKEEWLKWIDSISDKIKEVEDELNANLK